MEIVIKGTRKEQILFDEVNSHFEMADEDAQARWDDWDTKYELFRSYIGESGWPYSAQIFVPQTFTGMIEKMGRLVGGKPRGRLIPREGADVLKAKINNEILNYQWDDATRADKEPMVAKWAKMDLNARLYGASFGIAKWKYETRNGQVIFDGPIFKVLNPKDCLPNPAYPTVRNWFQYRDYVTLNELRNVNDRSSTKPQYKNLNLLKEAIRERQVMGGDHRDINYIPKGRELLGLSDYLGKDESPEFKIFELITELRDDRKIVFAPKYGVVIQDEPNPYNHQQIPIVRLSYLPIDDDIYGLSEIEPIEKVQKAMNALTSQFIDSINMDLYRILHVRPTGVQMHTLEWKPGAKWFMNNPGQDVVAMEHSMTATNQFVNVYSVLTQMFKEALGETSAAFSSLKPFSSDKTATEVNDLAQTRNVRDNFNQMFLSEAIKEQMIYWLQMNQQFIFQDPAKQTFILRIVGREAINDMQRMGLGAMVPDTSVGEMYGAGEQVEIGAEPELRDIPQYPVSVEGEIKPKFEMDESGEMATVYVTPEDMSGVYDYIADVQPMQVNAPIEERKAKSEAIAMMLNPQVVQMLQMEGKKPAVSELMIDYFEGLGLKGAEKYFDSLPAQPMMNGQGQVIGGGVPNPQAGTSPQGTPEAGGMGAPQQMAPGQGVPLVG